MSYELNACSQFVLDHTRLEADTHRSRWATLGALSVHCVDIGYSTHHHATFHTYKLLAPIAQQQPSGTLRPGDTLCTMNDIQQ